MWGFFWCTLRARLATHAPLPAHRVAHAAVEKTSSCERLIGPIRRVSRSSFASVPAVSSGCVGPTPVANRILRPPGELMRMRPSSAHRTSSSRSPTEYGPCLWKRHSAPKARPRTDCPMKAAFWTVVSPHRGLTVTSRSTSPTRRSCGWSTNDGTHVMISESSDGRKIYRVRRFTGALCIFQKHVHYAGHFVRRLTPKLSRRIVKRVQKATQSASRNRRSATSSLRKPVPPTGSASSQRCDRSMARLMQRSRQGAPFLSHSHLRARSACMQRMSRSLHHRCTNPGRERPTSAYWNQDQDKPSPGRIRRPSRVGRAHPYERDTYGVRQPLARQARL
jgi:hypothetical protein